MKKYLILFVALLSFSLNALAQELVTVKGKVTDTQGEAMIGVNIAVVDKPGLGAVTDIDGNYQLRMERYQKLHFSYIGYESVEILVKDELVINVTMEESKTNILEEVVVTGLGAQRKITVTGAVTNVKVEELKRYPSSNLSNVLAGNVPGIMAMQTSGQPGKNTSEFWVRGISTFGASNSALILVDGFERNNLNEINVEDIESFTVLKDASATAIYGSKGANGVILITTKHGKAGKVNISAKVETSYHNRTITPQFVDGETYAALANEARVTRNLGVLYQPEELEILRLGLDPDLYPNVDWMDTLLKDGAWSYRANINLSGGGSTARYFVSASYVEDEGMYKTDETLRKDYNTNANYRRTNYRMNVDMDITKTTLLKVGVSGSLAKRNSPGLGDNDVWGELFGYHAISTPLLYSNGRIPAVGEGNKTNPWVSATQTGYNEHWDNNLQTNVTLEQNLNFITQGMRFVGRFGYDTNNTNHIFRRRWPEQWKALSRNPDGQLVWDHVSSSSDMFQMSGAGGNRREFLDLLLSWDRSFKEAHNTGITLRYTQDTFTQTVALGDDLKNGVARRNQGLAGRFTYNWKYRYFFDFNFGYTGSENFAVGHQYGFFPAFSAAWNVAEEPFIKDNQDWLEMFKIRYSRGKVGNDNMGNERFPYLYTIQGTETGYNWGTASYARRYTGMHYTQVASPYITWEEARKDDLGIDLSLFHNNFSLTVDYFTEERTGIYMTRNYLPLITGLESNPRANVGAVASRGFDGNFEFREKLGDVNITLRGNMTYSKNEVLERDEENKVYPYQYDRGYRVGQQKGLIALGLFKDYDDIRNSPRQQFGVVQPGDIKYKDVNGDGVVDVGDKVAIGATTRPNLIYGLGASLAWKGFDFNFHFQGAGKSTFPIYGKTVFAFSENDWGNIMKGMLENRWVDAGTAAQLGIKANENPNAPYPRLSYGGNNNNQQESTFWLRDGRYLRLKNMDIGYTLPKAITNKYHFSDVRIFIAGSNLLTWSKFKLWDPESAQPRGEEYPLTRSVTMGLSVNL
ncbi:TonB-dependent receptor [Proteiniphilum sp.]|uniref:SusC/RagA family TonB-linked outer membrane protein n=1 Tax=Proteiniphilum sp. TaxID=1926877 RepID=UPI002B216BBF|nr:TonB-dependent receptor [Proteiniphilum sp.]MEA4918061.1 TonB-dependent receptor [Proteiniphilum sp.]